MAGEAAAEPGLDLAEGEVDLVVEDDDAVERHLERAAGRAGRVAGVVHVGLRQQDRDPRARRGRPALRRSGRRTSASAAAGPSAAPARAPTSKPTLWRVAGVARGPGLPRPTMRMRSPLARRRSPAAEQRQGLLARRSRPSRRRPRPRRPRPRRASPSSPTSSVSSSTSGSASSSTRGGERVAIVTSSGSSATKRDALGRGDGGELQGVVDLHRGDVDDDAVGDLGRQRFDGDLAGDVLEHAAALDAGGVLGALELDRDLGLDRLVELAPPAGRCAGGCRAPGAAAAP